MDKTTRDAEISRQYKQANYVLPPKKSFPSKAPHPVDPVRMIPADKELYWQSLLSDPIQFLLPFSE